MKWGRKAQFQFSKYAILNSNISVYTHLNKIYMRCTYVHIWQSIWVRAQHLDDGGGGPSPLHLLLHPPTHPGTEAALLLPSHYTASSDLPKLSLPCNCVCVCVCVFDFNITTNCTIHFPQLSIKFLLENTKEFCLREIEVKMFPWEFEKWKFFSVIWKFWRQWKCRAPATLPIKICQCMKEERAELTAQN